ncbi:MAG: alpha/beta fold hydrolase [Pseudomonadota bacterium]
MTAQADCAPAQKRRAGPSPLVLHMAMARWQYAGAQAGLGQFLHSGALPGMDDMSAAQWSADFGDIEPALISAALGDYCAARLKRFLAGVEGYQTHPFVRPSPQRPVAARAEGAVARDCGGAGPPVLLVPSLINPSWVLDLLPGRSFADALSGGSKNRVFLVDWGTPQAAQSRYRLEDYVMRQLVPLLRTLAGRHGPVHLAGYCLGGNLALAAALQAPDAVRSLTAIATPWDFAAMGTPARTLVRETQRQLAPVLARKGLMPAEALQALFAQLDPTQMERKFHDFALLDANNPDHRRQMEHFIAVEDWSNSGPPLAASAAQDCMTHFYHENAPCERAWRVQGHAVDPSALSCPSLVLTALKDKIVPPASTRALAQQTPGSTLMEVDAGHVGMMVGSRARALCWEPVIEWLAEH